MLIRGDRFSIVDSDMLDYLKHEAQRRSISVEQVYEEEMAAKSELAKITPCNADLLSIADRFPAPQEWYDE